MKPLVSDALWEKLEPLLPPPPPRRFRFPGRKPLDYRKTLTGILFVPKTGIAWDDLPADLGCGCGKTCRHHLRLWHRAGVWQELHALLLAELNGADQIDWSRALIDASFCKAPGRGRGHRPQPHGPQQVRQQAPRPDRRPGYALERDRDRRQRQRGHAGAGRAREQAGRRRQAGAEAGTAGATARQRGLRFRAVAGVVALAGDHTAAGPSGSGAWQRPGEVPLVCRADDFLVAFLRPLAASARPPHGDSRGLPPHRAFFDLFEVLDSLNLIFSERCKGVAYRLKKYGYDVKVMKYCLD